MARAHHDAIRPGLAKSSTPHQRQAAIKQLKDILDASVSLPSEPRGGCVDTIRRRLGAERCARIVRELDALDPGDPATVKTLRAVVAEINAVSLSPLLYQP